MTDAARWWTFGFGVATFLVAAKLHGRQIRLERELAGYWKVTFGGQNPAFVDALWRRERWLFWGLAAAFGLLAIGFRVLAAQLGWPLPVTAPGGERTWLGALLLHVLLPLTGAFAATGLLSTRRFVVALRGGVPASAARPPTWLTSAVWGTAGWWALLLTMGTVLCVLAWRRPA